MSERWSRAGEEKARPQNLGGGPSFREAGEDRGAPQQLPSAQGAARVEVGRRRRTLLSRRPRAPALHHAAPFWVQGSCKSQASSAHSLPRELAPIRL